jgi:hypothetical protein
VTSRLLIAPFFICVIIGVHPDLPPTWLQKWYMTLELAKTRKIEIKYKNILWVGAYLSFQKIKFVFFSL